MRWSVMSGLLIAVFLISGCSYGVETAAPAPYPLGPPENAARAPQPEAWLGQVCTALAPAVETSTAPAPEIVPAEPLVSRQRFLEYLGVRSDALRRAADGVNAAGPAPTAAGQSVTESVVGVLRERVDVLTGQVADLEAVPPSAAGTVVSTLQETRAQLVLAGPSVSLVDLALPPDLTEAARRVPACRALPGGV